MPISAPATVSPLSSRTTPTTTAAGWQRQFDGCDLSPAPTATFCSAVPVPGARARTRCVQAATPRHGRRPWRRRTRCVAARRPWSRQRCGRRYCAPREDSRHLQPSGRFAVYLDRDGGASAEVVGAHTDMTVRIARGLHVEGSGRRRWWSSDPQRRDHLVGRLQGNTAVPAQREDRRRRRVPRARPWPERCSASLSACNGSAGGACATRSAVSSRPSRFHSAGSGRTGYPHRQPARD
jgi:hypothetical protein